MGVKFEHRRKSNRNFLLQWVKEHGVTHIIREFPFWLNEPKCLVELTRKMYFDEVIVISTYQRLYSQLLQNFSRYTLLDSKGVIKTYMMFI